MPGSARVFACGLLSRGVMAVVFCTDQGIGHEDVGRPPDVTGVWRVATGSYELDWTKDSTFEIPSRRIDIQESIGRDAAKRQRCTTTAPDGEAWRALVTTLNDPDLHPILSKDIVLDDEFNADDGGFNLGHGDEPFLRKPSNSVRPGRSAYDRAFNALHAVEMAWARVEGEALASADCR